MTSAYVLLHSENIAFVEGKTDSLAEKNEVLLNLNRQIGLPYIPEHERYEKIKMIFILLLFLSVFLYFNILALTILSKIFVIPIQPQYVIGYFFSICGPLPVVLVSTYFSVQFIGQIYYLLTDFRQRANSRYLQLLEAGIHLEGEVLNLKPELHPRFTLTYRFSSPSGRKIKSRYTIFAACGLKKGDKIMVLYKDNKNHLPL